MASFTDAGLRVLGRGCSRDGGTAAAEASLYRRVCGVARRVRRVILCYEDSARASALNGMS